MKNPMFKNTVAIMAVFLLAVAFYGCKKDVASSSQNDLITKAEGEAVLAAVAPTYCKSVPDICLWAGQTINAGSMTISNDATNLYITVKSNEGFQSAPENIKLWVGNDLATLPVKPNGAPNQGHFPWKYTVTSGNEFTAVIPFTEILVDGKPIVCNTDLYVYVHVDIVAGGGGQTAWGGCTAGTKGNWHYYTTYKLGCCETPPPPPTCFTQTAFAKGGWIFTTDTKSNPEKLPSLKLTKNRWGWAINLAAPGTYTYEIWSGAGLNKTANGKLAGTLTVIWDATNATITYKMNNGFTLIETHVYAGDDAPTTIAPGQYGNTMGFHPPVASYTETYPVSDVNGGGIWIIAHAGVYSCY